MFRFILLATVSFLSFVASAQSISGDAVMFRSPMTGRLTIGIREDLGESFMQALGPAQKASAHFEKAIGENSRCSRPIAQGATAFCSIDIAKPDNGFFPDPQGEERIATATLTTSNEGDTLTIGGAQAEYLARYGREFGTCAQIGTSLDLPVLNSILPESISKSTICTLRLPMLNTESKKD